MSKISLLGKKINTHGFARFYFPGEENIKNGLWHRNIEIALNDSGSNEDIQLELPSNMLIPLSTEKKNSIIYWNSFSIKSGTDNTSAINMLTQRSGWNQTEKDVQNLVQIDPECSFTAIYKDDGHEISLGSGLLLRVGENLFWIGMILVHPELRRQGIAKEIMKNCICFARLKRNSLILGLDATPAGKPLYNGLGFKESFRIWRSTLRTDVFCGNERSVQAQEMNSVEQIMNYLLVRSLSDKAIVFKFLFSLNEKGCFIAIQNEKICGIVLSRPGRIKPFIGHLVADSNEIAQVLLDKVLEYWKEQGHSDIYLDIPEFHFQKKAQWNDNKKTYIPPETCYLNDEIKPVRVFVRMYHLVSETEVANLVETGSSQSGNNYKNALHTSAKNYGRTKEYMEKEQNNILPYLKCIGGPEIS